MKTFLSALTVLSLASAATAQGVKNTSYVSQTGEKVLRLEVVLPVSRKEAWELFTKDQQLQKWIAPVAHMELKAGGQLLTNYDKTKPLTDSSSIRLGVVNYLDQELLTLKVNLNNNFAKTLQQQDQHLQEVIQFIDHGKGSTKVVASMIGWGQGPEWDKTYSFFDKGNTWTFEQLLKLYPQSAAKK